MTNEEYMTLFEEIPETIESDIEDMSDNDIQDDMQEIQQAGEELFDINAMDVDFSDIFENVEREEPMNPQHAVDSTEKSEDVFESEDEISLAELRSRMFETLTIWTKDQNYCLKNMKEFSETVGPNVPEDLEQPVDVFLQIFPKVLIEKIVFQTNLYALQSSGGNENAFVRTNVNEIKTFLGINLLMGIKKLPSLRDYWSSRRELRDPYISSCMPRDRFEWLIANLHVNDNSLQPKPGQANFDKLYKLRPMLDALSETFLQSYLPSKNQAIDESMIKFKGRSSLRQYMPMKPVKRGYKVWLRADESGYISKFQIYSGKVGEAAEKNLGARVVKELSTDLIGKGHYLYFDNFFNSIELQKQLQKQCIYACGTARKGRKDSPLDIKDDKDMQRGESDWRVSKDGLVYMKWKDKKGVLFISNHHNPTKIESVGRKQKDGTIQDVNCPSLVKDYNANMGFVDKMDMLKSIYEVDRKSKTKSWPRIFWYFVDISVVNAYIILKNLSQEKSISLKLFRLSVVSGLIGAEPDIPKKGRKSMEIAAISNYKPIIPQEIRYDKSSHMPVHAKPRRCAHCSTRNEPHKSSWSCSTCNVGLCLNDKKKLFFFFS